MLVMSNEIIGYVKRFMRGFEISPATLALDVIAKVGPGGGYLSEEHTFKHFRQELWRPNLSTGRTRTRGSKKGCKTYGEVVTQKALEILETHKPEPLPANIDGQLAAIVAHAEQDLAGKFFKA